MMMVFWLKLVELLKQPQYQPQSMEREVVTVWSGTTGQLDDVPVEDIRRFDSGFLDYIQREQPAILETIRQTSDLSDDTVTLLTSAIQEFKRQFTTHTGEMLIKDEPVAAISEDEIDPTQITRSRRA